MNQEQLELIENLCDDASYGGIGYWASEATNDPKTRTYDVVVMAEYLDDEIKSKTLTYEDILEASRKLATGEVSINPTTKAVCQQIISDATDVDYDAEDADCIIQVAMFGDVLFG
jgi:hypothetical protein